MVKMHFMVMTRILLCFLLCFSYSLQGKEAKSVMKKSVNGQKLKYLISVPDKKPEKNGWPVLLFLHGAGERGNDLEKVKVHGPPKLINKFPELQKAIVISPQCPQGSWWIPSTLMALLNEVIEIHKKDIDKKRIYLSGLSMGGYGSWNLISKNPNYFAAAAPICGGGEVRRLRNLLKINDSELFKMEGLLKAKELPIWVFHGSKDNVVPQEKSEVLVSALKEAGSKSIKFTSYKGVGHDSWTKTYNNPEFYRWLFSHSRKN
jgi:predicted peptidase